MRDIKIGRLIPGGGPIAGMVHRYKRHADNAQFASLTTDANGVVDLRRDWSEGPYYVEADKDGVVRIASSRTGGTAGPVNLLELVRALRALGTGVIAGDGDGLAVAPSPLGGMRVRVGTGACVVDGIPAANDTSDAADDLTVPGNSSGSTRVDRVVVRVHRAGTAEEGRSYTFLVQGTPGAGAPPPKRDAEHWDLPLAQVTVANGVSAILSGAVADERPYVLTGSINRNPVVTARVVRTGNAPGTIDANADVKDLNASLALADGVVYDVVAEASLQMASPTGLIVEMAPYVGGTANVAADFTAVPENAGIVTANNAHARTVTGRGVAINCGVLVRKKTAAGGAGSYYYGHLAVTAIPRS